jgi:FkbM family methyltransferase
MQGTRALLDLARERWALKLWSAKQVRNRATYRLWYLKHVLTGEAELRFVASLCDRNRWTLDVGANRGMYAVAALPFSKGVIAFEPQPHLAALMRKCLPRTVEVIECAVSHANSPVELIVPADPRYHAEARIVRGPSDGGAACKRLVKTVSAVRLDDFVDRPVGLVKIDVEGHELAVLDGASMTIKLWRPNVIVELEERHGQGAVDRARAWFGKMNYEIFWVRNGRLTRFESAERTRSPGAQTYIYNFIFLPSERSRTARSSLAAALSAVRML